MLLRSKKFLFIFLILFLKLSFGSKIDNFIEKTNKINTIEAFFEQRLYVNNQPVGRISKGKIIVQKKPKFMYKITYLYPNNLIILYKAGKIYIYDKSSDSFFEENDKSSEALSFIAGINDFFIPFSYSEAKDGYMFTFIPKSKINGIDSVIIYTDLSYKPFKIKVFLNKESFLLYKIYRIKENFKPSPTAFNF